MDNVLAVTDATLQDVKGLIQLNKQLLMQALELWESRFMVYARQEKTLISMASVISNLKSLSNRMVEDSSLAANDSTKQSEQRVEEAKEVQPLKAKRYTV